MNERSSYGFAKEQIELANQELTRGEDEDWRKRYLERTQSLVEDYESQFPEKVIK
ncbi:MAG: hypothetical protein ACKVLL_15210 [Verrucomicrobiales bacterium]